MRRREHLVLLAILATAAGAFELPGWRSATAYRPGRAFTLEGWLDHTSTWVSDSSYAGAYPEDLHLHTARLVVGAHGRLSRAGGLSYVARTGATMAQNSLYQQRIYTPEWQADLGWTPVSGLELGLFGRYGWRRPNAFLVDSLRRRDLIVGARLSARPAAHTELAIDAGNRRVLDEGRTADHRFLRAELEQRIPAWNQFLLRGWGENAWYGLADSLDFDLQRSLAGLSLAGELPGGVLLHSNTALVQRKGIRRVLGQNRVRVQNGAHRLSANAGADYSEYDERDVYRRFADASWRWMRWAGLGTELRAANERVRLDGVDDSHRRDLLALAVYDWRPLAGHAPGGLWRDVALRGDAGGGWAETRQLGRGLTGRAAVEVVVPVEPLPWLGLSGRELLRGELFRMRDRDQVAPRADELQRELDHLLSLAATVMPHGTIQGGHRAEWRRHAGSRLVYSGDTLRNTLSNELWFKLRRPHLQTQVSGLAIHHLVEADPVDLEYRLALQFRWQPIRLASYNLRGVWRPERDPLAERMWVRSFVEFELNKLILTADLRFVGDPSHFGSKDTEAWIHVLRRLW